MNIRESILNTVTYGVPINEMTDEVIELIKSKNYEGAAKKYIDEFGKQKGIEDKKDLLKNVKETIPNVIGRLEREKKLRPIQSKLFMDEIGKISSLQKAETKTSKASKGKRKYKQSTELIDGKRIKTGQSQKAVKKSALEALQKVGSERSAFIEQLEKTEDTKLLKRIAVKIIDSFPKSDEFKEDKETINKFIKTEFHPEKVKSILIDHLKSNRKALEMIGEFAVDKTLKKETEKTKEAKEKIAKAKIYAGKQVKTKKDLEVEEKKKKEEEIWGPETEEEKKKLTKEEMKKEMEKAKKGPPHSTLGEDKEEMLKEAYGYRGTHFWENYIYSNISKAFNEDMKAFGAEEAKDFYVEFYGEETSPIFEYMVENQEMVESVCQANGLLFEGQLNEANLLSNVSRLGGAGGAAAAPEKLSSLKKLAGGAPSLVKSLWSKFKEFGKGIIDKIGPFVAKGFVWAKELAKKGFTFFTMNPIMKIAVPAVAIAGTVSAAIILINKARKKAGVKKMDNNEMRELRMIVQKKDSEINKLRGSAEPEPVTT